jgi:hypothetical protein
MRHKGDSMPAWVRWLLIAAGVAFVGLVVLGVAVFFWPWVSAFR